MKKKTYRTAGSKKPSNQKEISLMNAFQKSQENPGPSEGKLLESHIGCFSISHSYFSEQWLVSVSVLESHMPTLSL